VSKQKVLEFQDFCEKVLGLNLTPGQKVLAKVAFGNYDPVDLVGEEKELALTLFGGVERVAPTTKRFVLMRLGRGSGKTTMIAAYAVYRMVTADISLAGPGSVPHFIVIAPDKPTARISVGMAREMIKAQPALERLVVNDTELYIQLRRPDGKLVRMEAFAAAGKGNNVRSRDIMDFLFEEAEFLTSNAEGERNFAVDDQEIFRALKPRLMPGGKGILISTPWPTETLMGMMFELNWSKPTTALAIKAPTILIRNEPHIKAIVEEELEKDPENARRELFCELDGFGGGAWFDGYAVQSSFEPILVYPGRPNPLYPIAVGCDLGFTRDSSAIAVVDFDGVYYRTLFLDEIRPTAGEALKPSKVIKRFAEVTKRYSASGVIADVHYREALKEQLEEHNLVVFPAPEGAKGKADVFTRTRAVLHEGLVKLPECPDARRLASQCKMVSSKPMAGGQIAIKVPRKLGNGHGDLVSAWTLAVHNLAYQVMGSEQNQYEIGSPEWNNEFNRRIQAGMEKQQDDYLRKIEAEGRKRIDKAAYRRMFGR
jgi:hypothetical protein